TDLPEIAGLERFPLSRRGALAGGLVSGLTIATSRALAQEITTQGHATRRSAPPELFRAR
ncbi:MAG: hypothetical protein ACREU2_05445, partial [Steroidobacteraceae bacterium]